MMVWLVLPSNDNCTELFGIQEAESVDLIRLDDGGDSCGCAVVDGTCQGRSDMPLPASRLSSTRIICIGLSPMFSAAWVKGSR